MGRVPDFASQPEATMSRSFRRHRLGRHFRAREYLDFESKAERRAAHVGLVSEVRQAGEPEDWLDVLADFHEENGRFVLAERLRRGRDSL